MKKTVFPRERKLTQPRYAWLCLAATVAWPLAASADAPVVLGEIGPRWTVASRDGGQTTGSAMALQLTLEHTLNDVFIRAKGRASYDALYEHSDRYGARAADQYRADADWRHLYAGIDLPAGELTLGWQQVVWGRADELRVLDQVNPIDGRDGPAAPLDDSRIALPMLRATHQLDAVSIEALWLFDTRRNRAPVAGSEFDAPFYAKPDAAQFSVDEADYDGAEKFGYGLQLGYVSGAVDSSVVLLSARQQDPVYGATGLTPDARVQLQQQLPRYTMAGTGFAIDVGDGFVVRTEVALFHDYAFTNPARVRGVTTENSAKTLLALDYLYQDWLIAAQWQHDFIDNAPSHLLQPQHADVFTLSAEGNHLADTLTTRLVLAGTPPLSDDVLLQCIVKYKPRDDLRLGIALDVFAGSHQTLFGFYDRNDRLRLLADYLF